MTLDSAKIRLSEVLVGELSAAAGEPGWLQRRRLDAWRAFEGMSMPNPLEDEWRRTDLTGLSVDSIMAASATTGADVATDQDALDGHAAVLRQHEGEMRGFQQAALPAGVIFTSLRDAATSHADLIEPHLHRLIPATEWKLQALQAAAWSGGAFLYVPRNLEVELPLRLISSFAGSYLGFHLLVVAEENSGVTLIHEASSEDVSKPSLVTGAVEIVCGANSRVRYLDLQRWGSGVSNFVTMRAELDRGADLACTLVGLGSKLSRTKLEVAMEGEGARADIIGLTYGDGDRHFDYLTLQDHTGPRTASDLLIKAALDDKASEVWNGTVRIHKGSSQSEASQTSRNLLLSKQAKAAPIPVLEIEAYDVLRCSHGATAGPVDEEQMFYLESRGIPAPMAERLLVQAFFQEVVDRISVEPFREQVMKELELKIDGRANDVR